MGPDPDMITCGLVTKCLYYINTKIEHFANPPNLSLNVQNHLLEGSYSNSRIFKNCDYHDDEAKR